VVRDWLMHPTAAKPLAGLWLLPGESHAVIRRRVGLPSGPPVRGPRRAS
jgi:hypothetical protein